MIFYMPKDEEPDEHHGWIPLLMTVTGPVTEDMMKKFKVRINEKVYKEYNDELVEAHKADIAWDLLLYRGPND